VSDLELLRLADVMKKCKLSRTTIWRKIKDGDFPKARKIGGLSFWEKSTIENWICHSMSEA